jgi:hypothetical protein
MIILTTRAVAAARKSRIPMRLDDDDYERESADREGAGRGSGLAK